MGCLRHCETGDRCLLMPEHLVGRSPRAALWLKGSYVSAQHASLRWVDSHWELKDLGSRNGTRVNERPLEPGQVTQLQVGTRISFGRAEQTWELVDDSPPRAMVVPLDGRDDGLVIEDEIMPLPSQEVPVATIFRRPDGTWKLEQHDSVATLVDGQVLDVEGRKWKFTCPPALSSTSTIDWPSFAVRDRQSILLRFLVSSDEEHVELRLSGSAGDDELDLGSRAHNYLLLYLARQRVAEAEQGIPEAACGWVYRQEILEALRIDRERLNLDVFRVRKHFALAGVRDAAAVIERRPDTSQLRIGITQLSIQRIGQE